MLERIGGWVATTVRWMLDFPESPYFGPVTILVILVVGTLAVRVWRWMGEADARDEERKRKPVPEGSRHEDV